MKKISLLLVLLVTIVSCDSDNEPDHLDPEPSYTVEGKWLWSPDPDDRSDANTMFEFVDGNVYTSYCITCPADDAYWNSLDTSNALPTTNPYTFKNDTLRVNLHHGNELVTLITYGCDGGKLFMDGNLSHLWRLSSDCE